MAPSPLTLQSLSVLYWLTQQPRGGHYLPEEVCPADLQPSVHHELARADLVVNEPPGGGPPTFGIESRQLLAAQNAAASYRQSALQRHILEQLKKAPHQLDILGYLDTFEIHGPPATEEELIEAERALNAHGLMKGLDLGGNYPLNHPEITPAGEAVLRSPYPPEDALHLSRPRGGPSTSYYGDVNNLNQFGSGNASLVNMPGQHNTAQVHQSAQGGDPELSEALDRIETVLQQYAPEHAERLGGQIDLIRQMNRDDVEPGLIRQMINGLSNGLGQVLGQRAPELIDMALSTIPSA